MAEQNTYNINSGYGQGLFHAVASVCPVFGRILVVSNSSDENYNKLRGMFTPYNGRVRHFTSLADAYDSADSNANDVILLDSQGTHSLSAGILWAKNRVHLIGIDGGNRYIQQGAKVQLATAATTAYVIKNTGVRNHFENVKFIQASTDAAALTVFQDGGEGTTFKNCSFVFGVVNNLDEVTAHEFLAGSDSATFIDCTFGADTLLTSGARSVFHIDQVNGFEFKSNILKNCRFILSSSSSTATFVRLDAVGDVLFSNLFEDCSFVASVDSAGGAAVANAVQTGTSTVKGGLYFVRPASFNVTDFCVATNGWNTNVQVVAAVSVAAAIEGIKPTA